MLPKPWWSTTITFRLMPSWIAVELLCDRQVRAVTQPQVHRARWVSHLHAEAAGDLVFHAGIAILEVVALRVAAAPELSPGRLPAAQTTTPFSLAISFIAPIAALCATGGPAATGPSTANSRRP